MQIHEPQWPLSKQEVALKDVASSLRRSSSLQAGEARTLAPVLTEHLGLCHQP